MDKPLEAAKRAVEERVREMPSQALTHEYWLCYPDEGGWFEGLIRNEWHNRRAEHAKARKGLG